MNFTNANYFNNVIMANASAPIVTDWIDTDGFIGNNANEYCNQPEHTMDIIQTS